MFVVGQNKHRSKADPQIDKNRWAQFVVGQREATLLNSWFCIMAVSRLERYSTAPQIYYLIIVTTISSTASLYNYPRSTAQLLDSQARTQTTIYAQHI